jgi:hypothetical protein
MEFVIRSIPVKLGNFLPSRMFKTETKFFIILVKMQIAINTHSKGTSNFVLLYMRYTDDENNLRMKRKPNGWIESPQANTTVCKHRLVWKLVRIACLSFGRKFGTRAEHVHAVWRIKTVCKNIAINKAFRLQLQAQRDVHI